ncbi:MAG: hypothetical protein ACRD0C_14315 [Acidimicrobiia bacterium]
MGEGGKLIPLLPPSSEILCFGQAGPRTVQRGVEFSRDWGAGRAAGDGVLPASLPWPEAAPVEEGAQLFLSFGDVPHPDYVEVRVYGRETDDSGLPTVAEPLSVLECRLTEPRREKRIRRWAGGVGVEMALAPGGVRRIAAWASWDVPLLHRRRLGLPEDTEDLQASWLFTLSTEPRSRNVPGSRTTLTPRSRPPS